MLLFATLPLGPKRYYNNQNLMQRLKHILNGLPSKYVVGGRVCVAWSVQFALLGFSSKPLAQTQIHCLVNHPSLKGTPPQVYAYATMFLVVQNYPPGWFSWIFSFVINRSRFHLVQQISKVSELWKIQPNQLRSIQLIKFNQR
jgi:hypothetical protein